MDKVITQLVNLSARMSQIEKEMAKMKHMLESTSERGGICKGQLSSCLEDPAWVKALPRDSRKAICKILGSITTYSMDIIQKKADDLVDCGHDAGEVLTWALHAFRNGRFPMAMFLRNLDTRPRMGSTPWGPRVVQRYCGPSDVNLSDRLREENRILGIPEDVALRNYQERIILEYKETNLSQKEAWELCEKYGADIDRATFEEIWNK